MLSTVYKSGLLEISHFDCDGHDSVDEEASFAHEIVVPLDGLFLRRDSFGDTLADSKHLLFFNRDQPHEISHPAGVGESCLLIQLEEKLLLEMLTSHAPRLEAQADRPFERGAMRLDTRQQWEKYHFLSGLKRTGGGFCPHPQPLPQSVREGAFYPIPPNPLSPQARQGGAESSDDSRKMGEEPSFQVFLNLALEEDVLAWLNRVFGALYEEIPIVSPLKRPQREAVHAVQIFLNDHSCESLSLEQIAASVHYSPFMLCRLFKQEFGLSIHQYLSDLRLSQALDALLTQPELAIGDLGMALGYNSHSHFSAAFARAFGVSPSEARDYFRYKNRHGNAMPLQRNS
jgi:AraC-like DNA-binding protein